MPRAPAVEAVVRAEFFTDALNALPGDTATR
jgi:hypothetical protein